MGGIVEGGEGTYVGSRREVGGSRPGRAFRAFRAFRAWASRAFLAFLAFRAYLAFRAFRAYLAYRAFHPCRWGDRALIGLRQRRRR